ncbi:glycosyltransferase involved in cell wall biosynthesis [Christiangramia gaetbulicola]|uniref:Glycosyltransferase involved in cell wall biosynthesis n=1 Tax=Christiangramia gaetbulicola TaxID=703340 RepID=A0A2T6AFS3_9FLAO|nr:glycosyltransferase [Christiangramia gaetbulicola]PTX42626.1 glycosyltransferase involved in cell wall biosynthesis [Christiangramia gaetbulicola]
MKILHLIHKHQNRGAETFTCQLSNHQSKIGHEVKIVAVYNGEANLNWKDSIESLIGDENKFIDWKAWKKLSEYVNDFKPDIIQANSGDTLKYAVLSKITFGWKTPIIFRNASEVGQYLNSNSQKMFNYLLYRKVSGVASVSKKSKNDLIGHFSFLEKKTTIIPIGLEEKTVISRIKFDSSRRYNIVHVGGFSFEKNHEGLIRIFRKVVDQRKDIHLHLIGDGPLKSQIENFSNEFALNDYISFYGFVNNPLDYIKAADLLVLPSIIEGLPGVLLEAMYCKTPVIAYDVGGISEIVKSQTGTLMKKDDKEGFANAILEKIDHPDLTQLENAYNMVARNYMNKKLATKFLNFYKEVLE